MSDTTAFDLQEQIARIRRAQAETEKFAAEQRKLASEADKLARDTRFAPWQLSFTGAAAGAAIVGALATITKLFH